MKLVKKRFTLDIHHEFDKQADGGCPLEVQLCCPLGQCPGLGEGGCPAEEKE